MSQPLLPLILRDPAMPQPQIKFARATHKRRSGMTLIELLVAVSILVIIAAILVPQLRFASADRNIREASRVVASLFAQASQRAINDGVAGVVIERNPNILDDATGLYYAGTSMFILREVPRYSGESALDVAEVVRNNPAADFLDPNNPNDFSRTDIFITLPSENGIIRRGDQISFASQPNIRFFIEDMADQTDPGDGELKLRLRLESVSGEFLPLIEFFPDPPVENQISTGKKRKVIGPFIVYRQPRKLVSSRIDMPTGYLVDLRLSGETDTTGQAFFGLDARDPRSITSLDLPTSISYLFNGRGSIDRFSCSALVNGIPDRLSEKPTQPAYLMVREYSTDDGGELIGNVLGNDRNMWVTVDPVTGTANVVSGVAVDLSTYANLTEALIDARTLSSQGQQAAQ